MKPSPHRCTVMRWCAAAAIAAGGVLVSAQQLPSEPQRQFGTSITGAFEGWFDNPDGSRSFLVGYLNRNTTLALDVPIGPNNRIEPGGPDMGQPTHFLPGRQWGMFTVTVPKGFTTADQRLTWTIVANGQPTSIPLRLHPDYNVSPFAAVAVKNTPPVLRFEEPGPAIQGPIALFSTAVARATSMSSPLVLSLWPTDDARFASGTMAPLRNPPPPVELVWSKYRGPGAVTFDTARGIIGFQIHDCSQFPGGISCRDKACKTYNPGGVSFTIDNPDPQIVHGYISADGAKVSQIGRAHV